MSASSGTFTDKAIELGNAHNINIGTLGGTYRISITDAKYGIYSNNSGFNVYATDVKAGNGSQYGIYATAPDYNTYNYITVGSLTLQNAKVQLLDLPNGISFSNMKGSYSVHGNQIRGNSASGGTGILMSGVLRPSMPSSSNFPYYCIDIYGNQIRSFDNGIDLQDNPSPANIVENAITTSGSNRNGIKLMSPLNSNFNPSASFSVDNIENNSIIGSYNGIRVAGRNNGRVFNNVVNILNNTSPFALSSSGILIRQCTNNSVTRNVVTGSTTTNATKHNGIELANTSSQPVICNTVSNVGNGIRVMSPSASMTIRNNNLFNGSNTCNVGIGLVNAASIGPQGSGAAASDNQWGNVVTNGGAPCTANTITKYSGSLGNSIFYVRAGVSGLDPRNPPTSPGISGLILFQSGLAHISDCPTVQRVVIATDTAYARSIIRDLEAYPDDSLTYRWWNRYNLYSSLLGQDSLVATDTILVNFMNAYAITAPAQINLIKVDIDAMKWQGFDQERYNGLKDALDAVATDNMMDYNLQRYAGLYLQTLKGIGINELRDGIKSLAKQCVFENGPAVLEARTYMEIDSAIWAGYAWDDICTTGSLKTDALPLAALAQTQKADKPSADYRLVPNLYRDNFTAHIMLGEGEQGDVLVYGLDGRLMGRHPVKSGINQLDLSADGLQAGVYLYRVYVNGESKTNGKLVVVH